jgi:Tfp pilus assembly protein PilN
VARVKVAFKQLLERIRDRLIHRSQVGKQKLDAAFLRRELDGKLRDLGEAYRFQVRYSVGSAAVPDALSTLMAEVAELEEKLESKQQEIAQLENEGAIES